MKFETFLKAHIPSPKLNIHNSKLKTGAAGLSSSKKSARVKKRQSLKLTSHKIKPNRKEEKRLAENGYHLAAGLDEVGRGCLAGPVVASAIILPCKRCPSWFKEVKDSKFLSPEKREYLYEKLICIAISCGTGVVGPDEIDAVGITRAVHRAMQLALEQLSPPADSLLIDHFKLPESSLPQWGVTNGDTLCRSIAAASIIAKVTRDRLMAELDKQYPGYGLAIHKGYATRAHYQAIARQGLSPIHRRSFCESATLPAFEDAE
jgi:ribonuclease HII